MSTICADSTRLVCPLFQGEEGGSTPTSALQLRFGRVATEKAVVLNSMWHSRVPNIGNSSMCFAYSAEYDGLFYAVALWSAPVAREFNGRGYLELRRMAIAPDSPKFTASRMLAYMVRDLRRNRLDVWKLISYQDTEVHKGTIYRAQGWKEAYYRDRGKELGWSNRGYVTQTKTCDGRNSPKIRWEYDIRPQKIAEESRTSPNSQSDATQVSIFD